MRQIVRRNSLGRRKQSSDKAHNPLIATEWEVYDRLRKYVDSTEDVNIKQIASVAIDKWLTDRGF